MRQNLLLFALLSAPASAFLPRAHVALRSASSTQSVGWMLTAEARNSSDVSKENVGDYRDSSVPSSRTDHKKLSEVSDFAVPEASS